MSESSANKPSNSADNADNKISRRDFLMYILSLPLIAVALFAYDELNKLIKRGVTPSHILNVIRHIAENPNLLREYLEVKKGIEMGEVVPKLSQITVKEVHKIGEHVEWSTMEIPGSYKKTSNEQPPPIKCNALVIPMDKISGTIGEKPEGEIAIPLSNAIPPNHIEPGQTSGFIVVQPDGDVSVETNQSITKEDLLRIVEQGGSFQQAPFTLLADTPIPKPEKEDTYLWSIIAVSDRRMVVFNTNPGVRISVPYQLAIIKKFCEEKGMPPPSMFLLSAKGSSSGIGTKPYGPIGPPLGLAREESVNYLNLTVNKD